MEIIKKQNRDEKCGHRAALLCIVQYVPILTKHKGVRATLHGSDRESDRAAFSVFRHSLMF